MDIVAVCFIVMIAVLLCDIYVTQKFYKRLDEVESKLYVLRAIQKYQSFQDNDIRRLLNDDD